MTLSVTGFIDGSTVHGETLRRAVYASTAGATGVTRAGDFAVNPTSVPSGSVLINRGGGVIATKFPDSDPGQSYTVSNNAPFEVSIPANETTSEKKWEIFVQVSDPQYAGQAVPADPANDPYAVVKVQGGISSNVPVLWLATIYMPAMTATVTADMIRDRRELALPRSSRVLKAFDVPGDDKYLKLWKKDGYQLFPESANWHIFIPDWAVEARVKIDWQSVRAPESFNISQFQMLFGGPSEPHPRYASSPTTMVIGTASTKAPSLEERRINIGVSDTINIRPSWRGRTLSVASVARMAEGTDSLYLDSWSSVSMDIQFVEAPESEGTNPNDW